MKRTALLCSVVLSLASPLLSQDAAAASAPKPEIARLDALLGELAELPDAAWDARLAAMRASAAAMRAEAKASDDESALRTTEAAAKDLAAKAIDGDAARLLKLRESLGALKFRDGASEGDPAKLERVLGELGEVPAGIWAARLEALGAAATNERADAASLREAAKQSKAAAEAKLAMATALDGEIGTLAKLRATLVEMKARLLAPAASEPAQPLPVQVEPALAEPGKSEPAKAEPAKTATAPVDPAKSMAREAAATTDRRTGSDERLVTYVDHVFPIFDDNCITCHERGDTSGGLDLSTHATALQGGGSGRTIRPGDPEGSRLYALVSHREKPTMPPDEPRIDKDLIETIRLWIAQGAPKDRAEAERLAQQRAVAQAKAATAASAPDAGAATVVEIVMPDLGRLVAKRVAERSPAVRAVAVAPHAPLLAVAGLGQVLLLHAEDLRELGALAFAFGQVERIAFSADGSRLLVAGGRPGRSGAAVVYDLRTATVVGTFGESKDATLAADLSPDGQLVAFGGPRRTVEVVRVADGTTLWETSHDEWITDLCFSPDGMLCASADRVGQVQVREAATGREVHAFGAGDGGILALAFSADSTLLATGSADRSVRAFGMKDGNQAWSQTAHSDAVTDLCWAGDGRLLSAGADGRVLRWRADGRREKDLQRLDEWLYAVAALDDDRILATDWQGRISVLGLKDRKLAAQFVPLAVAN